MDEKPVLERAANVSSDSVKVRQAVSTTFPTNRLQAPYRLETTATYFGAMENWGQGIHDDHKTHPEQYSAAQFFTKRDSMHEDLLAIIASISAEVRDLSQQQSIIIIINNNKNSDQGLLGTLYAELRGVHDDMESSYRRLKLCSSSTCVHRANMVELLKHTLTEVGELVTAIMLSGTTLFIERAFRLRDIHKRMEGTIAQLQNSLEKERIPALDKAVLDVLAKVMPTKPDVFALPFGGSSAVDAAEKHEH
ncbi:hypothetical protein LZ31DRAFT_632210 [Colletotrichum somersetense]|nr:hypothetical protein LZ31DRAFT_632210 [Colletotrichum somersetense]